MQAEAAMRALVQEVLPSHAVFGEEGGMSPGDGSGGGEYLWIFDPIDGTKSFITGAPAHEHPSSAPAVLPGRVGLWCPSSPTTSCQSSFMP